ncbi:MAG: sugar phosphorylase [Anaerolineae bacterium]|nr:sugar phosphorylase [Anaerolineae bacterium]
MSDTIYNHLEFLYGADQAKSVYEAVQQLMKAAHITASKTPAHMPRVSNRDVTLITYADSLQRDGERPLQTLAGFVERRLKGWISTVHILPFYPYSSDDGFSVMDYYAVNPAVGEWGDIQRLNKSVKLMFDLVINHASAQSEWFKRWLADDPEFAGLFLTADPKTDTSSVTRPRTSPLLTPFQKANGETAHVWTTFSADQVDFDFGNPATLLKILAVLLFYCEQGAQVIRLDAIGYLWKQLGTSCIHLPQTHAVVQLMRAVLDAIAPDVVLITETNVPHAENVSYFGDGMNEAQLVYNFTLPPLLLHTMLTGKTHKLREWVNTLDATSTRTTFFNFTASHDGIGVRPVEGILNPTEMDHLLGHVESRGGRVSYKSNTDGSSSPYELNITYLDAVINPQLNDEMQARQFLASQAVMLAIAGVPAVYIHSLLGSHNDTYAVERLGYNRAINRSKLNSDVLEAELKNPATFRAKIFNGYLDLIRARTPQPAFHPNAYQEAVDLGSDGVFAVLRDVGGQRIVAIHNLTATPQRVRLNNADVKSGRCLNSGRIVEGGQTQLAPFEVLWLEAD